VGESIQAEGGILLNAKFDQMVQLKPFSTLALAFDQFCDYLMKIEDAAWVELMVGQLKDSLGQDAVHLVKIVPKLGLILGCSLPVNYA
jgi:hypothetical protein